MRKLDTDMPAHELLVALEDAVEEANSKLRSIVEGDPSLQGMGTTLTAMLWSGSHIALVHIGDSRGYLRRDGELFQGSGANFVNAHREQRRHRVGFAVRVFDDRDLVTG